MFLLRNPRFWLIFEIIMLMAAGYCFGYWKSQFSPDSSGYIRMASTELRSSLTGIRTLGYPILLKIPAMFCDDWSLVPALHWILLAPGVLLFDFSLRRFGIPPWTAFILSTGMLLGSIQQLWLIPQVLSDFPAVILSATAMGCLLWLVAYPRSVGAWFCVIVITTATYHIRPVYLFLIPLLPVMAIVAGRLKPGEMRRYLHSMMLAGTLFIALMTPFVLYCAMRWHLVGHFGLVAFGGVSASGLATELLDAQILEGGLPAEIQPLAEQIYRARQEAGMKNAFYSGKLVNLYLYDRNYGDNTFRIAVPISQRMYGKDSVLANERLTEFSHAVISQRKGLVLLWAAETYPRSVLKLVAKSWVMILMIPLVLVVHGMRRYWFRRQSECEAGGANRRLLVLFSLLAVSMFLANLTLVIMSGVYADSRYVVAGAVLVPCPLAYVLFSDLKAICGAKREAVEMDNRIVNSHPSRGD